MCRKIKLSIFIFLVLAGVFILPDKSIVDFMLNHFHISGDGEEAIDNFDFTVLLLKLLISVIGIGVLWTVFRFIQQYRKPKR